MLRVPRFLIVFGAMAVLAPLHMQAAPGADGADSTESSGLRTVEQFLSRHEEPSHYRATRRLEARNRDRYGWLEAWTEYSPATGLRYGITSEGGCDSIRGRVLKPVLEGERDLIARGVAARSALAPQNYEFHPEGLDANGLVRLRLTPRRKDGVLVNGSMLLTPHGADLVRVEGMLAKSPSFWVKSVQIVRHYQRIAGVRLPVALESTAQVRFLGASQFRMTYDYSAVDGRPVAGLQAASVPPLGAFDAPVIASR